LGLTSLPKRDSLRIRRQGATERVKDGYGARRVKQRGTLCAVARGRSGAARGASLNAFLPSVALSLAARGASLNAFLPSVALSLAACGAGVNACLPSGALSGQFVRLGFRLSFLTLLGFGFGFRLGFLAPKDCGKDIHS
jgi:hypothetical protein